MFKELNTEGMEESQDRLGGFQLLESGGYDGVIKLAYVTDSSKSDAKCVVTVVDYDGHEMTERTWVTSGKGEPYYERDNKKIPLPGYDLINSMCLVATGLGLSDQDIENKTIKVWDKEAGKEIEKSMPVIISLLGKQITAGILKQTVNKQKQEGDKWVDTNESRDENVTDKYFHFETKRTVAEIKNKLELADDEIFYAKWTAKNAGQTRNRFKEVKGAGGSGSAGTGSPAGKSKSLFS